MPKDIISLIQESVIQGRITKDDEGMEEGMVGQPGVRELVEEALASGLSIENIITKGLSGGMNFVG